MEKNEILSPNNALKQIKDNISPICEHFGFKNIEIEKIDLQWRNINLLNWKNTNSATEFWSEVYIYIYIPLKMPQVIIHLKN